MSAVYDFRHGHAIKGVQAQQIGERLDKLRAEHGTLNASIVLNDAESDEQSPLRTAFTWDDSEAASKQRLNEARRLIVSIRVLNSPTAKPTVAFVSVRTPGKGREYVPVVEAMSDEEISVRVLTEVRQFIEGMERRYAHFEEVRELLANLKQKVG